MSTVAAPPRAEQHIVLNGIDWKGFCAIADAIVHGHVRLAYDGERLELMTTSHGHEWVSSLLARLLNVLTEELDVPMGSAGSTTFRREDVAKGIEPDQCFYLDHEPLVRGKDEIDLSEDPPPDLAIEVEISRSALDRMGIYAALGVPELWRSAGTQLRVYNLTRGGKYRQVQHSRFFPEVPIQELEAVLQRRTQTDETSLIKSFRNWVRKQIASGWKSKP